MTGVRSASTGIMMSLRAFRERGCAAVVDVSRPRLIWGGIETQRDRTWIVTDGVCWLSAECWLGGEIAWGYGRRSRAANLRLRLLTRSVRIRRVHHVHSSAVAISGNVPRRRRVQHQDAAGVMQSILRLWKGTRWRRPQGRPIETVNQ